MSEATQSRDFADLRASDKNPRKADSKFFRRLQRSMEEFGDLGCIVRNVTTGKLVGGTQRTTLVAQNPTSKVVITQTLAEPNAQGTVALGYVEYAGEQFKYREVKWDEPFEDSARIAANAIHGEWDTLMLGEGLKNLVEIDPELAVLTGIEEDNIKALLKGGQFGEEPDGTLTARPKQTKYSAEDLRGHATRFTANVKVEGLTPEQVQTIVNGFLHFLEIGEQS